LTCVSLSEMKYYHTLIIVEITNSLLHCATASHSSCVHCCTRTAICIHYRTLSQEGQWAWAYLTISSVLYPVQKCKGWVWVGLHWYRDGI